MQLVAAASLTKNRLMKNKGITFGFAHTRHHPELKVLSYKCKRCDGSKHDKYVQLLHIYIYTYTVQVQPVSYDIIRLSRSPREICVAFCVTQNITLRFSYYYQRNLLYDYSSKIRANCLRFQFPGDSNRFQRRSLASISSN